MNLEAYKDIVGTCASVTTIAQFFSGVFICRDIIKDKSTKNVSVMPFLGGIVMSVLMLRYSTILQDVAMTHVNYFGMFLNCAYFLCYCIYTAKKQDLLKQVAYAATFTGVILSYSYYEEYDLVEYRYGIIVTVLLMLLIASPLFSLGEIIRTKSTATLPFPLILSGTLVTFQWLLYGIIIKNQFIQFQNAVGFILSVFQLSLFVIYPNRPTEKARKKVKKN